MADTVVVHAPVAFPTLRDSEYQPPRWLRNPHLQSALGSSAWRRKRGAAMLEQSGAAHAAHLVDGGNGVRLSGIHSAVPGGPSKGLAVLLHGWEGSAESGYMRMAAAHLLQRGFEVFRLNFRDHGDTHHLNPDIFHSNRLDEVIHALIDIAGRFSARPMLLGGYSLGGNFALRLALHAPRHGLPVVGAAAVCPVLDPALTLVWMERVMPLYRRYFERKWRGSLERKRMLFPDIHTFDDRVLNLGMRELTRWLVEHHTDFGSLDNYFDGYALAGERLSALEVPVDILVSEDDPVIPVDGFRSLQLPDIARLEIARWGGHCAFIEDANLGGYSERWVAERLSAAVQVG